MKKTFTINISGIIFHIDDDAYNKLNSYIANIKRHFNNFEGKEEVIADIESRIAEILQTKLSDTKEVIVVADVDEVISTMGEPAEFTEDETEENQYYTSYSSSYKRLYRDAENKIIGGVASGIGAYLHVDPVWIRLLFILLVFTSLGVPIYIILWIAVPEALSPSERLQMKGEKINISNIEKSVKEEFDNIKDRVNDFADQAKETYQKKSHVPKTFFENVLSVFGDILRVIGKAFVIFLGIILLIVGFSLTIGLIAGAFGVGNFMIDEPDFVIYPASGLVDFFVGANANIGLMKLGLFFFIVIPVIMILYAGVRIIFGFERIRNLGSTAFALWIVGLALCLVFAVKVSRNFQHNGEHTEIVDIEITSDSKLLHLHLGDLNFINDSFYEEVFEVDNFSVLEIDDSYFINEVHLDINETRSDEITLEIYSRATGRTYIAADRNASDLDYGFKQEGNHLYFDEYFEIPEGMPFLDQSISLKLNVPVGYKIDIDRDVHRLLYHHHYNRRYYRGWDRFYEVTREGLEAIDEIEDEIDKTIDEIDRKIGKLERGAYHKNGFILLNHINFSF